MPGPTAISSSCLFPQRSQWFLALSHSLIDYSPVTVPVEITDSVSGPWLNPDLSVFWDWGWLLGLDLLLASAPSGAVSSGPLCPR